MNLDPNLTQAFFETGAACFQVLNVRAIRRNKTVAGVHWLPYAFFNSWGVYNLWFYAAIHLPAAWWAGLAITCVNAVWLGHVAWYAVHRRGYDKGYREGFKAGYDCCDSDNARV